jgi:hypothetical protein
MVDLYINPQTGDLDFSGKRLRLTANNAELTRQRVVTSLRTFRGEWFYNILEGIPYLENPDNPIQLIGKASKGDFDAYIKQSILAKPFVKNIKKYSSSLNPITSSLNIYVEIDAGDDSVNGEFQIQV